MRKPGTENDWLPLQWLTGYLSKGWTSLSISFNFGKKVAVNIFDVWLESDNTCKYMDHSEEFRNV